MTSKFSTMAFSMLLVASMPVSAQSTTSTSTQFNAAKILGDLGRLATQADEITAQLSTKSTLQSQARALRKQIAALGAATLSFDVRRTQKKLDKMGFIIRESEYHIYSLESDPNAAEARKEAAKELDDTQWLQAKALAQEEEKYLLTLYHNLENSSLTASLDSTQHDDLYNSVNGSYYDALDKIISGATNISQCVDVFRDVDQKYGLRVNSTGNGNYAWDANRMMAGLGVQDLQLLPKSQRPVVISALTRLQSELLEDGYACGSRPLLDFLTNQKKLIGGSGL